MTANFRNYLFNLFRVIGGLLLLDSVCAVLEQVFQADFAMLRWGIWVALAIAALWFIWRFHDGFFKTGDFLIDDNDHRWR